MEDSAVVTVIENDQLTTLTDDELQAIDAWWRANNYLTIGQIYLQANPLLREPLTSEHIKPRLLGHWGTSPGCHCSTHTPRASSSAPGSR
jgi:xylulose-5-phosphate/fructose-6-phosphate phosphoketolase